MACSSSSSWRALRVPMARGRHSPTVISRSQLCMAPMAGTSFCKRGFHPWVPGSCQCRRIARSVSPYADNMAQPGSNAALGVLNIRWTQISPPCLKNYSIFTPHLHAAWRISNTQPLLSHCMSSNCLCNATGYAYVLFTPTAT